MTDQTNRRVTQLYTTDDRAYTRKRTRHGSPKAVARENASDGLPEALRLPRGAEPSPPQRNYAREKQPTTTNNPLHHSDHAASKRAKVPDAQSIILASPWSDYDVVCQICDLGILVTHAIAKNSDGDGHVYVYELPEADGEHGIQKYMHLTHDNVVKFISAYNPPGHYFVVLEVMKLSLWHVARCPGALSVRQLKSIIAQVKIIQGLNYLEKQGLAHGNLNPSNILISSAGRVKLCGQEKFQQWSSELAYADVQSLRSLIILLAEKDEKQEKIDPLKWPDFLEIVGELELATSIKNLSPTPGATPFAFMFWEPVVWTRKACNAAVNFRHYAIVDRYSLIGPYCVGDILIYSLLFTCNILVVSFDFQLAYEKREYAKASLRVGAANAGYAALVNAVVAYLIVLSDTKPQKEVHKLLGISTIALCTFHSSVKLLQRPSMNTHQELHTTILIICLFLFALVQVIKYFAYEVFILSHRVIGIVCAYSTTCHIFAFSSSLKTPVLVYFATLSLFYVCLTLRMIFQNYHPGMMLPRAIIASEEGVRDVAKLVIHVPRYVSLRPGQYIKLWMPRVELFSVHSFMVAKAEWDHQKGRMYLTCLIQRRSGFSKKILNLCSDGGVKRRFVLTSVPQGSSKSLEEAETVIMIVTGLGFWSVYSYLEHLVRLSAERSVISRIVLVWRTKCISPQEKDAINRLILLDQKDDILFGRQPTSKLLQHVVIFDESTALQEVKAEGRIIMTPNSRESVGYDLMSAEKLELLVKKPMEFVMHLKNGGPMGTSCFDVDEVESLTAILVSADDHMKDGIKKAISKSTGPIKLHELEYTPYQSPSVADNYSPFGGIIPSNMAP